MRGCGCGSMTACSRNDFFMDNQFSSTDAPRAPALRCLDDGPAPAEIVTDLSLFAGLPEGARRAFWTALGPSLAEPLPRAVEAELDDFCGRHGAKGDTLARVLKACRFLVREASKRDLPLAAFAEDVAALAGADAEVRAVLAAGYEKARAIVRRELVQEALLAHGTVLTNIDWRIDVMRASSSGARLNVPVAHLALDYRDGDKPGRLVLQLPLATVEELKRACEAILRQ